MLVEEANILEKIKEGENSAFEYIYHKFYTPLCVFATRITGNQNIAEEIVQEIIIKIWEKRENIKIEKNFKAYLFRAVHNSCINFIKKKGKESECLLRIAHKLMDLYLDKSENIIYNELEEHVNNAIEELPEQTKIIFKQSRYDGLKYHEIAKKEGISIKGVEFHISKALQLLKDKLKEHLYILLLILMN